MGNTEDVTPNASPDMTDAQKVNEYVSWYLNGVINKKEYPPSQDNKQIVNYTGPINKLLPAEIQETSRATTVKNAKITRHDQIVGCVDLLGLGKINTCDPNNILQKKARLSDWENNLPPERSEFDNAHDYQVEYSRWRGNSCIEIFGLAFCFDSPWKVNWPGKLFSNIPLSSTEDLEGNIKVSSVSVGGEGVSNVSFSNQTPATLFFPHIQESDELGSILQDTYLAKDEAKTGQNVAVEPPSSCTTVDVRSNKGDNLFAKSISGNLGYTASFSCVFDAVPNPATCATTGNPCDGGKLCCTGSFCNNEGQHSYCRKSSTLAPATPLIQTCSKTFSVSLSTLSNTPKIDDVWSRLVAGPTAVVKRMFPKLGTQIGTLKDLPGSTGITYSGDVQGSGELNLPHIGGISEYFLKGIQTLLRPKGYGESISFGSTTSTSNAKCGLEDNNLDAAMKNASTKYGVPEKLLRAILQMETPEAINNPSAYICEESSESAAGIMKIMPFAYQLVTCESERLTDGSACAQEGKLSRCSIHDSVELAARVLLWQVGLWPSGSCSPTGTFPNNKQDIYRASCGYYGSLFPDAITIHAAQSLGAPDPINRNYCDGVCFIMGTCPPFPSH